MVVDCHSDASIGEAGAAGVACWVDYPNGDSRYSSFIKETVSSINYAEMFGIARSVGMAINLCGKEITEINVYCDNQACIDLINGAGKSKAEAIKKILDRLINYTKENKITIKAIHVRGHSASTSRSSIINKWCDNQSRARRTELELFTKQ